MSSSSSRAFVRSVLVLSLAFAAPPLASPSGDGQIVARAQALQRSATVDCSKIKARDVSRSSSPRATESLAEVGTPLKLNDENAPSLLTAGVWSPAGDSIAFVAPTDRIQPLKNRSTALLSGDPRNNAPRAIGVSINEIWIYQFQSNKWSRVTADGARPRFSKDGKRLLYLSSTGARAIDMATFADESLGAPEAGEPEKRFHSEVLSDGSVLRPAQTDGVLRQVGTLDSAWAGIELEPQDEVRISPNEERLAVIYNASERNSSSAVVVYDKAGTATTVLKNCPGSAIHLAWSQDGNSLAYPMRATGQPEVWVSNLSGGPPQTKVRLHPAEGIGALSLSPDNELIAFSQTGHTGRESIWIASKAGMQRVAPGLLGQWSLQGDRLLYAVRRADGALDWHVVSVTTRSK